MQSGSEGVNGRHLTQTQRASEREGETWDGVEREPEKPQPLCQSEVACSGCCSEARLPEVVPLLPQEDHPLSAVSSLWNDAELWSVTVQCPQLSVIYKQQPGHLFVPTMGGGRLIPPFKS